MSWIAHDPRGQSSQPGSTLSGLDNLAPEAQEEKESEGEKEEMTRLARALNSSDLEHQEYLCDVDMLQAAGLTAIHRGLGMLILEAREGAAGDGPHSVARVKALEQVLERRVNRLAQRWHLRVRVSSVSRKVASELVLDRCIVCQGRGSIPMRYDGQRMVAVSADHESLTQDVDCHVCLGSGAARRDYYGRAKAAGLKDYSKKLGEFWEALLQSCTEAELGARRHMWSLLRTRDS